LDILAKKEKSFYASYDLSAATDRLPIVIQQLILSFLFGEKLAKLWANLLTQRDYELLVKHLHRPDKVTFSNGIGRRRKAATWEIRKLRYAVGQPMGALSS
jgi:hypothetical protein